MKITTDTNILVRAVTGDHIKKAKLMQSQGKPARLLS
jgi:hypothetical protein